MRRGTILALATIVFVGCVKDMTNDVSVGLGGKRYYATIAPTESRVQLNQQKQTVWNTGDEIVIFNPDNTIQIASFDGKTGDRDGSFTTTKTYTLSDAGLTASYAVYASNATDLQLMGWGDGMVASMVRIPSTQTYLKDSYASNVNVMIGTTTDGSNFTFKNVLGYLRLAVTGEKEVRAIRVESNGGETLAGDIVLRFDDVDYFAYYQNTSSQITIDCSQGVQLSDTPTYFYVAIAPIALSQGFTATIEFADGTSFAQSTSNAITIERNYIHPMNTLKTNYSEDEYRKVFVHHTAKSFVTPLVDAMNGSIDWGDGTVSMLKEFTSYNYLDNATSHTITIKVLEPKSVIMPSMKGVTKLDFSNF